VTREKTTVEKLARERGLACDPLKVRTVFLGLIFVAVQALAADFQTLDGTKYKGVIVKRVEADGIVVETDVGVEKLYFNELPKEVQERYANQARAAAADSAATVASEAGTTVATKPMSGQEDRNGAADTHSASSGQTFSASTVHGAVAPIAPPSPTPAQPLTPLHTYELKQDYVIGGDTGAVAKRLAKGQRYRGRDAPDGIQLEIDGKMYTVPRDILSAAKD
jgi:hypothetical protein